MCVMAEVKHLPAPAKNCLRCRRRSRVTRPDGSTWQVCLQCYWATGSTEYEVDPSCPRCRLVLTDDGHLCDACEREVEANLRRLPKVIYT